MVLTLSIPIRSKAAVGYNAFAEFTKTYNDATYGFSPITLSDLPSGYVFDPDVINYIIEKAGKGFNYKVANESGIVVEDWVSDQTNSLINFVFGTIVNAYIATASFVQDYIYSGAEAYRWYYTFTGADESYPGWDTYGTAYGFRFEGICGDKIDIVLDSNGDFYGNNPLGNIILDQQTDPYEYIRIHQGNNDPTDPAIYAPTLNYQSFSNLKAPYIEGKSLHFFVYDVSENVHEIVVPDFTETNIIFPRLDPSYFDFVITSLNNFNRGSIYIDGVSSAGTSTTINNYQTLHPGYNQTLNGYSYRLNSNFNRRQSSINYPSNYTLNWSNNILRIYNPNALGLNLGEQVPGSGDIWLKSFSYTPNSNPQTTPENPIPITELPDDPEDPLPSSNPDPVPGITYPVNPTPPPLRPVPSIVSGNDDLWPSVIELQNIEIDLSSYLASLGDFEFPDLNVITESFAGSIIWVSALMSTLFNGSDFSILFAVLSSFFIVAALLGLYKWWNHK